jgi:predicted phage tail protein
MTNIILHGALGKRFGKEHKFFVRKPVDAIRALMANKKGFSHAFRTWGQKGKLYEIICDDVLIDSDDLLLQEKNINEIHIVPTVIGSGNTLRIIIGVVLVIVGLLINYFSGGTLSGLGNFLIQLGIGMIVGGILGILFPPAVPQFEAAISSKSFVFSSLGNETTRGGPVKIGYGRLRVGSNVVSTALEPTRLGQQGHVWPKNKSRLVGASSLAPIRLHYY